MHRARDAKQPTLRPRRIGTVYELSLICLIEIKVQGEQAGINPNA
jgi:hypothetical protein